MPVSMSGPALGCRVPLNRKPRPQWATAHSNYIIILLRWDHTHDELQKSRWPLTMQKIRIILFRLPAPYWCNICNKVRKLILSVAARNIMQRANLARGHLHTCCVVVTSSCGFKVRSDAVEPWSSNWECVPHLSPNDQCHNMYQTQTILIVGGWAGRYLCPLSAIQSQYRSQKESPILEFPNIISVISYWSCFEWFEKIFPYNPLNCIRCCEPVSDWKGRFWLD